MADYEKITDYKGDDIPNYSMAVSMELYKTDDDFIIPMFPDVDDHTLMVREDDEYHVVTVVDQYRPDLISYRYYDVVDYLWVILLANGILDPFRVEIGTILRIPSKTTVLNKWLL